jgi:hypothetical protein
MFDINEIEEIQVRSQEGNEVIYRGKGLEKFRRMMIMSPQYGETIPEAKTSTKIVDNYSSEDDHEPSKSKKAPKKEKSAYGYLKQDLNYSPSQVSSSKNKSAVDIAKEMQRQAEEASGIKF